MDYKVKLCLKEYMGILEGFPEGAAAEKQYNVKLLSDRRKPEHLELAFYYETKDFLYQKLTMLNEGGVNVLGLIQPAVSLHRWEHLDYFDFSQSTLIEIKDTYQYEHDKKILLLIIDNLDVISHNAYSGDARFRLTENIFAELVHYYHYGGLGTYSDDDKFIESCENRNVQFGPVSFRLSFNHFYSSSSSIKEVVICRDAYLILAAEDRILNDAELQELGNGLCLLMSFYWGKKIDFFYGRLKVSGIENYRSREIFRWKIENIEKSEKSVLSQTYRTFYDFAESLVYDKFQSHKEVVEDSVNRLIKVRSMDTVSGFMIMYNIIEKLRNYFLLNAQGDNSFTIKEEFNFTESKRKTEKVIRDKIKEVVEIVAEPDKAEFLAKASDKVNFIKKTGLIDQFTSFIEHLSLNASDYNVQFDTLIKIRNSIYHGNMPQVDLRPYNTELKAMIYDILLVMLCE